MPVEGEDGLRPSGEGDEGVVFSKLENEGVIEVQGRDLSRGTVLGSFVALDGLEERRRGGVVAEEEEKSSVLLLSDGIWVRFGRERDKSGTAVSLSSSAFLLLHLDSRRSGKPELLDRTHLQRIRDLSDC